MSKISKGDLVIIKPDMDPTPVGLSQVDYASLAGKTAEVVVLKNIYLSDNHKVPGVGINTGENDLVWWFTEDYLDLAFTL